MTVTVQPLVTLAVLVWTVTVTFEKTPVLNVISLSTLRRKYHGSNKAKLLEWHSRNSYGLIYAGIYYRAKY